MVQFQRYSDVEIRDRPSLHALFITNPAADKLRIESAKGPLLEGTAGWIFNNDDFQAWLNPGSTTNLLWIHGGPGTGKTMLLCAILDELRKNHAVDGNLAFFFCERNNERTKSAEAVLRGLLFMLATHPRRPSVIKHIRDKYNNAGVGMFEGPNIWWSLEPVFDQALVEVGQSRKGGQGLTYLVIDALDECEIGLEHLLELIAKSSSTVANRVKWLVTSRGREGIRRRLRVSMAGPGRGLDLDDHAEELSDTVENYIRQCAVELTEPEGENGYLYRQILAALQKKKANGAFLHVALVARELRAVEPGKRLRALNKLAVDVKGVYRQAEERIRDLGEKEGLEDFCHKALSAVAVAHRPLREEELRALAGLDSLESRKAGTVLTLCEPFFVIGNGEANFIHESAREYFQRDSVLFTPGLEREHHRLFSACLEVMKTMLRRDPDCPTSTEDGEQTTGEPPMAAAEYACDYWIEHLTAGEQHDHQTRDGGALFDFLQSKFLCWLEYLARYGRMRGALSSWTKLVAFLKVGIK